MTLKRLIYSLALLCLPFAVEAQSPIKGSDRYRQQ
jgi:hypothetical protein